MPVPDKENEPWIMALPGLLGVLLIVVLVIYLVKAAFVSDDPVVHASRCELPPFTIMRCNRRTNECESVPTPICMPPPIGEIK